MPDSGNRLRLGTVEKVAFHSALKNILGAVQWIDKCQNCHPQGPCLRVGEACAWDRL